MGGRTDGRTDRQTARRTGGFKNGWMVGWMAIQTQTHRHTDRQTMLYLVTEYLYSGIQTIVDWSIVFVMLYISHYVALLCYRNSKRNLQITSTLSKTIILLLLLSLFLLLLLLFTIPHYL